MSNALQEASSSLANLNATMGNTKDAITLLDRLDAATPSSRAQRAPNVKVSGVQIKATFLPGNGGGIPVIATATTGEGSYQTRITFHPKQGFHCTCPDFQQRKHACKHVSALGVECRKRFWAILDLIERDVETISIQLTELESAANTLAANAGASLKSFKDSLES